jgi:FAD-dependent urate hydroxylase
MKVIIIGAGIAGLVLGTACQRAGFQVKVFDKASELRSIGGGVLLWPHGLRFLEDLGLLSGLQSAKMSVKAMNIVSHLGNTIYNEDHATLYSLLDGEILPIDRSLLQQRLLYMLSGDVVKLDSAFVRVESNAGKVQAVFADGSVEEGDLIVGADGVNSAVRLATQPESKAAYSGFCWWGGMVDRCHVPEFPVNEVQFILGKNKICSVWPTCGERYMWYLPVKMPLQDFITTGDGSSQAHALSAGWNQNVLNMITAPQSSQRFHVPIYELPPIPNSAKSSVTLIGDAACTTGPLLGQGANKAIEDAYFLCLFLQKYSNDIPQALHRFDALRYSRQQRLFELEHMSADALMHGTDAELNFFEENIPHINLTEMYQDMIPLVNAKACAALRAEVHNPVIITNQPIFEAV